MVLCMKQPASHLAQGPSTMHRRPPPLQQFQLSQSSPCVDMIPLRWYICASLLTEYWCQGTTYLYLGTPSDLACNCNLTLAVSRGKVAICNQASNLTSDAYEGYRSDELERLTSPVQAAMAELTNVAHMGRGLAFPDGGGDMTVHKY